jgi:large subunit ribosomal protein L21
MYAIIELGGRQMRVEPGTQVRVNRVTTGVGKPHVVAAVILASDGTAVRVGKPYVAGAKVVCEVLSHGLGPKTISYKFRRRENFRRTRAARQPETTLLVKGIELK